MGDLRPRRAIEDRKSPLVSETPLSRAFVVPLSHNARRRNRPAIWRPLAIRQGTGPDRERVIRYRGTNTNRKRDPLPR